MKSPAVRADWAMAGSRAGRPWVSRTY